MGKFDVHKATRNPPWDGYDPLDFDQLEPRMEPSTSYGGSVSPPFPTQQETGSNGPTNSVDLVSQGRNKDGRAKVSYGSGVDNKVSK